MRCALAVFLAALTGLLLSVAATASEQAVSLPQIENDRFAPRVIYLENPRFETLTTDELKAILAETAQLVEAHFGVRVDMPQDIPVLHIDDVFTPLIGAEPNGMKDMIGDFRGGQVDWGFMRDGLVEQIEKQKTPIKDQIAFAQPHLSEAVEGDIAEALAEAVVQTFKSRLKYWTTAKAGDGYPVIGEVPGRRDLPLNEYGYWSLMARQGIPAEIVLTNQLVASVEYMQLPVHTSIRGGITAGATEYNPASPLGSSVWITVFPMLSNDPQIQRLRNGKTYSRRDALRYAGAMLAHEMGHQLFHLGHPWSNAACVMRPAELLDFAAWTVEFDAENCRVGSIPPMEPGAIKIPVW